MQTAYKTYRININPYLLVISKLQFYNICHLKKLICMVNFIKGLKLRWSDLFLAIGFACFGIFAICGQLFMQQQDPANVALPLPVIIIAFIIGIGSFGTYLYLEHKEGNFKLNFVFLVFVFLGIFNAIVIACQPSSVSYEVTSKTDILYPVGTLVPVNVVISPIHKTMFAMEIIIVCLFIYIGLFLFPKRFKTTNIIEVLSRIIALAVFVIVIISFCIEGKQYVEFAKHLFSGTKLNDLLPYTVKSCVIHRNAYGMILLLGVIFAIVNHSITKSGLNYLRMVVYMIIMVFTLSKASLIFGALIFVAYIYFRLIYDFKKNKTRNLTLLGIISGLIITAAIMVMIAYISKGKYLGFLYIYDNVTHTLETRSWIWEHSLQTLANGNWVVGRGFGIINLIILPMNQVNGDAVFPTHSAFVNMLAEGGPIFLIAYLVFVAYSIIIIKRCWKKNPNLVFALTLGILTFFLYGFIETIQYVWYALLFPLFLFYEVEIKQVQKEA